VENLFEQEIEMVEVQKNNCSNKKIKTNHQHSIQRSCPAKAGHAGYAKRCASLLPTNKIPAFPRKYI
jgi:hypothetical protein